MMNNIIRVLLTPAYLYAKSIPIVEPKPIDILLDGLAIHHDEWGCCLSCGYNYCPSLDECVRTWETYCSDIVLEPFTNKY